MKRVKSEFAKKKSLQTCRSGHLRENIMKKSRIQFLSIHFTIISYKQPIKIFSNLNLEFSINTIYEEKRNSFDKDVNIQTPNTIKLFIGMHAKLIQLSSNRVFQNFHKKTSWQFFKVFSFADHLHISDNKSKHLLSERFGAKSV